MFAKNNITVFSAWLEKVGGKGDNSKMLLS